MRRQPEDDAGAPGRSKAARPALTPRASMRGSASGHGQHRMRGYRARERARRQPRSQRRGTRSRATSASYISAPNPGHDVTTSTANDPLRTLADDDAVDRKHRQRATSAAHDARQRGGCEHPRATAAAIDGCIERVLHRLRLQPLEGASKRQARAPCAGSARYGSSTTERCRVARRREPTDGEPSRARGKKEQRERRHQRRH